MARLYCKCGEHLSNSTKPEIQYSIFSDEEWISLLDRTDAGEKLIDFGNSSTFFWKCPNCGRLHFFKENLDTVIGIYKLEEE